VNQSFVGGFQHSKQVDKQSLPNTQLVFMHEVDDENLEMVKPEWAKL
jgi:hypothetical protein